MSLSLQANPQYHSLHDTNFTIDNTNVAVLERNVVSAVSEGEAVVTVSAQYNGVQYTTSTPITVAPIEYDTLFSTRTANGIVLTRIPDIIEVGEEYVVQAYILSEMTDDHPYPYGYADDNLVKFVSDNPGVCRVKNGVLFGVSVGLATITVTDITGTVSETFVVEIVPETHLGYTEEEVMTVTEEDYDWSSSETTTLAIIDILSRATEAGKKKVIFPNRIYEISPAYGTISVPSNMILDFSGAILQIVESALTRTGYQMILMKDVKYSSIENAIIYGERDLIEGTGAESCRSVSIYGSSYRSGLKNCTISKSPGFNIGFGNTDRKVSGVKLSGIVAGGLDDTGADVEESYAFRSDYTNIGNVGSADGQIWLGNMQGFGGYLYLSARVYNLYFYDVDKKLISVVKNCIQYYGYKKPENAVYARIVFWQASAPTSGDPDYASVAHLHSYNKPDRCYIKNCVMEDNYSLAISTNGGENMLIENNRFLNNGYRDPASHLDWEDGRQHNKGHVVRGNTFEGGGAVTAIGADGLSIHNNTFINVPLRVDSEVQNSRIWLNTFRDSGATITSKTDAVFSQNYGWNGANFTIKDIADVGFMVRQAGNVVVE